MLDLPISTLSSWIKREGWDVTRASHAVSIDSLIPKILAKIDQDIDEGKLNADALAKYCKQLRELGKTTLSINDYYQVMTKFIDFARLHAAENDAVTPAFLQTLIRVEESFLKTLSL